MLPLTLYAATTNAGKLAEFAASAGGEGVEVLALPGLAERPEPVEDAATFMGNAELKARAYSRLSPGVLVMADDSGLEVAALGGAPGVRSARFAEDWVRDAAVGPRVRAKAQLSDDDAVAKMGHPVLGATTKDERNNELLLALMEDVPEGRRQARFVCALALARDGEVLLRAEGVVEGELLREAKGGAGFGYDPLFYVEELGMTTAGLPRETKWAVGHRGKAFRELLAKLHDLGAPSSSRSHRD